MPKEERAAIEQFDELFGYLQQSHISPKNRKRLAVLAESPNTEIAEQAQLVLEIARVKPHKRRRLKFLGEKHPDLLRRLEETSLIEAHGW